MKKYTLIVLLTLISTIEIMANFPPSKEQIENAKKIEELRKTNGLTTISGDVGLGGTLVQPTQINVNGNSFLLSSSPLSAMGYIPPYSSVKDQWAMIANPQGSNVIAINNCLNDTAIGNEYISSAMIIVDISNGRQKGFDNKYNYGTTGVAESLWKYVNPLTNENINMSLDDSQGFLIRPYSSPGFGSYLGSSTFKIEDTNGFQCFRVEPNGNIRITDNNGNTYIAGDLYLNGKVFFANEITEILPSYADDADAGVNGLTSGRAYVTNGLGAPPLNVAGIRMIKQ